MLFVSETESAVLASHEMARKAVRQALIDVCDARTETFPVVHGHGSDPANRFTVKAAAAPEIAGLKVGSYWPGNLAIGLPRHNSLILLFDQEKGRIAAAIEAGTLNAYRTAAADAVAAEALARQDAGTLAIFGAGHQARYECAAVAKVRPIRRVLIVARNPDQAKTMIADLAAQGVAAEPALAEAACSAADIIVTATSATAPLFKAEWVRPGTHVASMGSDATGKQELPPSTLLATCWRSTRYRAPDREQDAIIPSVELHPSKGLAWGQSVMSSEPIERPLVAPLLEIRHTSRASH
jgi:ornithine cyclodeaminase